MLLKRRQVAAAALFTIIIAIKYYYTEESYPLKIIEAREELQNRLQILVNQEKGSGCVMPILDPFTPQMTKFNETFGKFVCDAEEDWVTCQFAECYVQKSFLKRMTNVLCKYEDRLYVNDYAFRYGEAVYVKDDGVYYLNKSDYVKVSCRGKPVDGSGLVALRWKGLVAGYRPVKHLAVPPETAPNVFILVIDSMSKNQFIRDMPISYKFMKDELHAVVMDTYNIVGHATSGNMIPVLTGRNELELPYWRVDLGNTRLVDPDYLIHSYFEVYGYETAYFEDLYILGLFNYYYNGFQRPPAHHYIRTLFYDSVIAVMDVINIAMKSSIPGCFGSKPILKFMTDYAAQLLKKSGKQFILVMSSKHSHDMNEMRISQLDGLFAEFLSRFKSDGHLEDTLLIVMGDHGQRFSHVRDTYQGKLEERLPLMSVVLPNTLIRKHPEALRNLKANSKVLTTPYDVHTTVLDAVGLEHLRNNYTVPGADLERGMSFLKPIPASRSCSEAGVMPHWCACVQWRHLPPGDAIYRRVATELARFINTITLPMRSFCVERQLVSIEWVQCKSEKTDMLGFKAAKPLDEFIGHYNPKYHVKPIFEYYQTKIVVDPGKAIFEGSLIYNTRTNKFKVSREDISRINRYGSEPACVTRVLPYLAPYCYCVELIK